jgi:DNA repair protein RecO (recombination protein O)
VVRSIILKKHPMGEADELVLFLSGEMGWLRGVAKNSRKSRVRFGGHLEPFALVDLILRPRKRDDLVWIDESQVVQGFLGIRSQVIKVAMAAYCLELASVFQAEGQPDPELFDFLLGLLQRLDRSGINQVRFMLDEIRLLGLLGYAPGFDACPACGKPPEKGKEALFSPGSGAIRHVDCAGPDAAGLVLSPDTLALVRRGLQLDGEAASRLRLGKRGIKELRKVLSTFVRYLRGREINSLVFLEKMGSWSERETDQKNAG